MSCRYQVTWRGMKSSSRSLIKALSTFNLSSLHVTRLLPFTLSIPSISFWTFAIILTEIKIFSSTKIGSQFFIMGPDRKPPAVLGFPPCNKPPVSRRRLRPITTRGAQSLFSTGNGTNNLRQKVRQLIVSCGKYELLITGAWGARRMFGKNKLSQLSVVIRN